MTRRTAVLAALLAACLFGPVAAYAQIDGPLVTARYAPALRFRTLSTGRFDIYFHQGEETLARRLSRIVELVAPEVDRKLGAPRGRVRVILVDQTDVSNGWATVVPYNLIELAAVPPPGFSEIGNTDDWLYLVFTHEYTHVVHLEKTGGWLGSLRHVFGRQPLFYPNLFLPAWQIEGLATYEESALTWQGRLFAGDFRMILDRAAATGRFASLDRATSAAIDWPGGTSAYLYGAFFHGYLAETYGEEQLGRLATETAGRLPFTGSRAFKSVYGKSLGAMWKEFEAATRATATANPRERTAQRLTHHGFVVGSPTFASDARLFYTVGNPHRFPSILEFRPGLTPREVTTQYHGRRLVAFGDRLIFDQLEVAGLTGLQSDLYAHDLRTGKTRRLTYGARAGDPDLSPDGRTIVCTIQQTGRRVLATLAFKDEVLVGAPVDLAGDDGVEYTAPRWSPDGRSILAERRGLGASAELVVIDAATGRMRVVFSQGAVNGRVVTPAWTRDGSRILFAWARDHERLAFTLYSIAADGTDLQQLSGAGDGAHSPAVSPDGTQLVFVGYTEDGYDLFAVDLNAADWHPVSTTAVSGGGPAPVPRDPLPEPVSAIESRRYSPLPTLLPRFWSPYFERDGDDTVIGAATAGFDALGRHTYLVSAGWGTPRNRVDIQADYTYARWWPAIFAGVADDTDARRDGFIRSRDVAAGVLLPFRRVRWTSDLLASASYSTDDLIDVNDAVTATRERTAGRAGLRLSSAKAFGYSISAEQGATVSVVSEFAHGNDGAGTARSVVADVRSYFPVFPRHGVVALRAAFATSRGDERVRREFTAGGSGPQGAGFDVGADAIGLLRGFDDGDVFGRSALVVNADYRVPFGWPQRGYGTLPFFIRAIHGAIFVDAGHAWDANFTARDMRRSVGGELSFDLVLGGALPTTVAAGVALRKDPVAGRDGATGFIRIGRAF